MNDQIFSKYKTAFAVIAALIALLEIPGALDLRNQPYSGYWTDPNNTVIKVFSESPAQQAGFLLEDHIISSGGIDMTESKALARRPRAKIGEVRTYVVERGGQNLNLDLTFAGLPAREVVLSFAGAFVGFCFLIFGLYAYWRVQNQSTTLLALVGICFGLAFVNTPYISSYALRTIFNSITITLVVLGFAFLLHFMIVFPKAKAFLARKNALLWLYGPAALVALLFLFLIIFQPEATSTLNTAFNIIVGLFMAAYLGLAVVAMVHSYVKATPDERAANGLHLMLLGTVIGLAPIIIYAIVGVMAPKLVLPGAEFYVLTMVLIPIALALAQLPQEKNFFGLFRVRAQGKRLISCSIFCKWRCSEDLPHCATRLWALSSAHVFAQTHTPQRWKSPCLLGVGRILSHRTRTTTARRYVSRRTQ